MGPFRLSSIVCVLVLGLVSSYESAAFIQLPVSKPDQSSPFRVSAVLLTAHAVVTDAEGRHVTSLGAEDFDVRVNGSACPVRQAVYVVAAPQGPPVDLLSRRSGGSEHEPARVPGIEPPDDRGGRTLAVVVDDHGMSWESTAAARRALHRFLDASLEADDLVAIIRASAGGAPLQQFTRDREQLHRAVERIQWTVASRSGVSAFSAVANPNMPTPAGPEPEAATDIRNVYYTMGSLGALEFIARGLEGRPGRKAVVYMSEGMDLFQDREHGGPLWSQFIRLLDRANRAGLVVYTIDPRGLVTGGLTAEDNPQPKLHPVKPQADGSGEQQRDAIFNALNRRKGFLRNTGEALRTLAEETGGFAVQDTNDLAGALARVLTDSNGYYLIGCQPPRDAEDADALNVAVRLRRQDLRLRARRGPFRAMGLPGSQNAPTELLMSIAMSPVQKGGLPLQLTATPESADSASIMSRLLFSVSALTFRLNEAGRREAQIEIVELLIDERGAVAASAGRRLELALDDAQHSRAVTDGIVYTLPLKPPAPGRYVLRVAVRDLATGATGSSSQTIEIPAGPGKEPRSPES